MRNYYLFLAFVTIGCSNGMQKENTDDLCLKIERDYYNSRDCFFSSGDTSHIDTAILFALEHIRSCGESPTIYSSRVVEMLQLKGKTDEALSFVDSLPKAYFDRPYKKEYFRCVLEKNKRQFVSVDSAIVNYVSRSPNDFLALQDLVKLRLIEESPEEVAVSLLEITNVFMNDSAAKSNYIMILGSLMSEKEVTSVAIKREQ
jgi:hypothetical protein